MPSLTATADDLPAPVAAALARADLDDGVRLTTVAAGVPFSSIAWGESSGRALVLLHGVTASARIWWRIGPALAASGRHVVAVDLPGHGLTGHWTGHHRFHDTAADVAAWIRAAGLDDAGLQVVGHSWGAMIAAALPRAGIRPATLVLLDPPTVPHAVISQMASDPSEVMYPDMATARREVAARNPAWSDGDVEVKAEALVQLEIEAARSVLLDNGDWDGGLDDLDDPSAAGIPVWLVRGDQASGSLVPDAAVAAFVARLGTERVITMTGAPHAPQRTRPEATTVALLRALA